VNAADQHLDPLRRIGKIVADRYRITSLIAQGGMGCIYLAEQVHLQEQVVVKFLHPMLASDVLVRERFRREAKALIRLRHPGIVAIHDFGEHEGEPYIALEHLQGLTLGQLLAKDPPLPLPLVLELFDQLLGVLESTHAAGIIHRDLKLDNVMVLSPPGESARVKVLDFGIARIDREEAPADTALTATGAVFGTPSFMSPEQCRGAGVVPESDVYSVAVMLFFALTRTLPFDGVSGADILVQQLHVSPPTLAQRGAASDLPVGMETLVARGLAKDPAQRPAANAFRRALKAIADGQNDESRDAEAALRRKVMAGLSREERNASLLEEKTIPRGKAIEPPPEAPRDAATVLLWGFSPARSEALKAAFAVNGMAATVAMVSEESGAGSTAVRPITLGLWDVVVISGADWASHLAALPAESPRPPVVVVDVLAASEIPALVRAGASDVALFTVPVDVLAGKLRRLLQRSRPNEC
jgi:tRNA A-37 threonylcarbamoyl transferase component Bud32